MTKTYSKRKQTDTRKTSKQCTRQDISLYRKVVISLLTSGVKLCAMLGSPCCHPLLLPLLRWSRELLASSGLLWSSFVVVVYPIHTGLKGENLLGNGQKRELPVLFGQKRMYSENNGDIECCWPYLIGQHPLSPGLGQMRPGTPGNSYFAQLPPVSGHFMFLSGGLLECSNRSTWATRTINSKISTSWHGNFIIFL